MPPLDPTLIQQIDTPVDGANGAYFNAPIGQPAEGIAGGDAPAIAETVSGDSVADTSVSLDLTPSVTGGGGGVGGEGIFNPLEGEQPGGTNPTETTTPSGVTTYAFDPGVTGPPGEPGGSGGAAELDIDNDTFGTADSPLDGSSTIDGGVTGGIGGVGGYGTSGTSGGYSETFGIPTTLIYSGQAGGNGGDGGDGSGGGSAVSSLDALAEAAAGPAVIDLTATGGVGGAGNGAGVGGNGGSASIGGDGGTGGAGGAATASVTGSTVSDATSIAVTITADGGAGGAGGEGEAGGEGSDESVPGGLGYEVFDGGIYTFPVPPWVDDIVSGVSGNGGAGGAAGAALAVFNSNTLAAPAITLALTAMGGPGGTGGAGGAADSAGTPGQRVDGSGDVYNISGNAAGTIGATGDSPPGQIDFTNDTITATSALSLTLHVEEDGSTSLLPLDGGNGGNLMFSGNSFIGGGSAELNVSGAGSDATVDDKDGTISIAGSPDNSMTGFDDYVLASGDTFIRGTSPIAYVYVAPDPDTIVLTPGHGALVLYGATSLNTILDFQGYGSTLSTLAQLAADTVDQSGDVVISVPGDGTVTLVSSTWTPSAAGTGLTDDTDTFTDQVSATSGLFAGDYLWSQPANWSNGLPASGAEVFVDADGTDDLPSLTLPVMTLDAGLVVAQTNLTIDQLTVSGPASLTVDSGGTVSISGTISGTGAILAATGAGAVLDDAVPTDNGETYEVANGGEVILPALVSFGSTLDYDPIGTSGTFALADPNNYDGAKLGNVDPGDVLEVTGNFVTSIDLDAANGNLSLQTDLGDYYFGNVTYGPSVAGFSAAIDPSTGLLAVTFTAGDTFNDKDPVAGPFLWSDGLNWSAGAPAAGGSAYMYASGTDDIAGLTLSSLGLAASVALALPVNLTVDALLIAPNSSVEIGNGATLTIQGPVIGEANGSLSADGAGSVLLDNAPDDPGETYAASNGGMVILTALPSTNSELSYDPAGSSGTFALPDPGATVGAVLSGIAPGDVLEVPGTTVSEVAADINAQSLEVTTDAGSYTFPYATYTGPVGYTWAVDPATGLAAITFTAGDTFTDNDAAASGPDTGDYLWNDALNWSSGIPGDGASIYVNLPSVDDIAGLTLASVALSGSAEFDVAADLTVGLLSPGASSWIFIGGGSTLTVSGTLGGEPGLLQADGVGSLLADNAAADPGDTYEVSNGGEAILAPSLSAASNLDYDPGGTTGTFALSVPGAVIGAALQNVGVGDVLELPGTSILGAAASSGGLTVTTDAGAYDFTNVGYAPGVTGYTQSVDPATDLVALTFAGASDPAAAPLCFLAGTLIATPSGETPVEHLAAGEMVLTTGGVARRIVWIGIGKVLATRGRRNAATPVIVRKGALADNVPHHDVRLTKAHALYLEGVLIPVEFLVNHRSVIWDDRAQEVSLYHIELETHDVLLANGAAAESYRDDGNRWLFQNANSGWDLPPKPPCAPVLTGGAVVDRIWRRLLDRSGPRGGFPLTGDADLHLMADDVRLDAVTVTGATHVFQLAAIPAGLRIVSRAAAPQELGLARDPRSLGVALRGIVVRSGARFRVVEARDRRLTDGFHGFEPDNGCRWTDGDAVLPAAVFAGFSGPVELVLQLAGAASYVDAAVMRDAA